MNLKKWIHKSIQRNKTYHILCIDGGGIRGVFPATLLTLIKERFQIDLHEHFDAIVGTSTGSILAGALAIDHPISDVLSMYEFRKEEVFHKRKNSITGLYNSKYKKEKLENLLEKTLGEKTMSQLRTNLWITSTNISDGEIKIFTKDDSSTKVSDAILSSCSAPLYFNPHQVHDKLYADGGLWANNPSLAAITNALETEGVNVNKIKMLSIGTGYVMSRSFEKKDMLVKKWGILKWRKVLVKLVMSLNAEQVVKTTSSILKEDNYVRLDFNFKENIKLDDLESITILKDAARKVFDNRVDDIRRLLGKDKFIDKMSRVFNRSTSVL